MERTSPINNPLVSVMIPVYNGEKEILFSLRSLLQQAYTNWECIIVNDGSKDKTLEMIQTIKDTRIRLFSFKENKGRPYARQKALEEAKGKYIAMLDADDWYYPEKLLIQVKYMEENPDCTLLSTSMAITGRNDDLDVVQPNGNRRVVEYQFSEALDYKSVPHAPSIMRASKAKKIKYDLTLHVGQDQDFMIRLLKNEKYALYEEILYVYNLRSSLTLRKYINGQKATIKIWTKQLNENKSILAQKKIAAYMKIFFGIGLNAIGCFSYLSSRRGVKPSLQELQIFQKNKSLIKDQLN